MPLIKEISCRWTSYWGEILLEMPKTYKMWGRKMKRFSGKREESGAQSNTEILVTQFSTCSLNERKSEEYKIEILS